MRSSVALMLFAGFTFSANQAAAQMPRECCGDLGMTIGIDFSSPGVQNYLNPLGNPLILFSIDDVEFSRVVDTIEYDRFGNPSLFVQGGQRIAGSWVDGTVRLEFSRLQCLVCSVTAKANPHGPRASLVGTGWGGASPITDVAQGNRDVELNIRTDTESPFCAVSFTGQELEIYAIQIE